MAGDTKNPKPSVLPPGTIAPEFKLHTSPDQMVALSEFRGAPVILAFYPADWSPVCGDQMALYNEMLSEFRRFKAELVGVSVDGAWCHLAYAQAQQAAFSAAVGFRAQGRGRAGLRRLQSRSRRHASARYS